MYKDFEVIDIFEFMPEEATSDKPTEVISVDDALVEVLNLKNDVDICYIAERTGQKISKIIHELEGVIYQQPEFFADGEEYDEATGWVVSSKYLTVIFFILPFSEIVG